MFRSVKALIEAHGKAEREVYLDLENSSPVPEEVVREMLPYFSQASYGNPAVTHKQGWMAYESILGASERIARFIGASAVEEVNFTHDETEANNLSIIGGALANRNKGDKIVISEIEPLSIIFATDIAKRYGFRVERAPVDGEGFVDEERLSQIVDKKTVLVSVSMVNHEIGTIQNLKRVLRIVKDANPDALFHTDASDAYGRLPIDVKELGVDLMALSSYKILGPRGVGVLYVREGMKVERLIEGQLGTQRLWPGVENTPLIVGFRKASELAFANFEGNVSHMRRLRDRLIHEILSGIEGTMLNGPSGDRRVADNVNVSFLRCEGEALTIELSLSGVYVSSGSACTRKMLQPSHVLVAIGRDYAVAHGSLLMKVTRYHADEDIDYVLEKIHKAVERIRSLGPRGGG